MEEEEEEGEAREMCLLSSPSAPKRSSIHSFLSLPWGTDTTWKNASLLSSSGLKTYLAHLGILNVLEISLGTGQTRTVAPSIAVLACLLQAWPDSAGLLQAGQDCNRWRHNACLASPWPAVTIYPGTSARWRIVAWKLYPIFKPKRWHQNQASIYLVVFSSWWIKSWHANENVICQNDNNLKYCSQKGGPINVKRFFGIRFNL